MGCFREEGFIRPALCILISSIRVDMAIRLQAMLKEIAVNFPQSVNKSQIWQHRDIQLPSCVTKLGASLA